MRELILRVRSRWTAMPRRQRIGAMALSALVIVSLGGLYLFLRDYNPPPAQLITLHYDDAMTLTGYTLSPATQARGGQKLEILLDWHADKTIRKRYVVHVQLLDARGHVWTDHVNEPANGKARTDRWSSGQRVLDAHSLDLPSTMPAGDYKIAVIAYDPDVEWNLPVRNAAGRMIADQPVIGTVQIEKDKTPVPDNALRIEQPQRVEMGDLVLLGVVPNPAVRVSRGEPLHIGLYWRARSKPKADYLVVIQLRDNVGNVLYENASRPAANTYSTLDWAEGEVLLDWHDFPVPITFRADPYQIFMVLRNTNTSESVAETKLMNFSVVR